MEVIAKQPMEYCSERERLLKRVKMIIINNLNLELSDYEIDDDSGLFGTGLGLDSIDALDLVIGVEEEFGIKIGENELRVFRSVNSLADYISEKLKGDQVVIDDEQAEVLDFPNDGSAYYFIRNAVVLYQAENDIYELPASEEGFETLSVIISGKTFSLEPNKCIQSLILNEKGRIVDAVYVMMFDEKFWVLTSKNNRNVEEILMAIPGMQKVSDDYVCVTIEGPYAWSIAKKCFGFEILGLTYSRFIEMELDDLNITIARLSVTGEYGYRVFVKRESVLKIDELIKSESDDKELKELKSDELEEILKIAAMEGRAVQQNDKSLLNSDPVENELRWMIDIRKSEYVGKEIIDNELKNVEYRVVAFFVEGRNSMKSKDLDGKALFVEDENIGTIVTSVFSPIMDRMIGYAKLRSKWGYVGIEGITVEGVEGITVKTVSTPVFIPKSAQIQLQ